MTPFKPGASGKKKGVSASKMSRAATNDSARKGSTGTGNDGSSNRKRSLAQQMAELANPTPKDEDPEDMDLGETGQLTRARVSNYDEYDGMDDQPRLLSERSSIRKHLGVEELSAEYSGRVVSRKQLDAGSESEDAEEDEEDAGDEEDAADDDEGEEDEEEEDEEGEGSEEDDEQYSDEDEEGEDDDDMAASSSMLVAGMNEEQRRIQQQLDALEEEDERAASLFRPRGAAASAASSNIDANSQYEKSLHMRHQISWYNQLLHARIRIQGALNSANRLPPSMPIPVTLPGQSMETSIDVRSKFETAAPTIHVAYNNAMGQAKKLFNELCQLQSGWMRENRTLYASKPNGAEDDEESDSRIPEFKGVTGMKRKRSQSNGTDHDGATTDDDEMDDESVVSAYWSYLNDDVRPVIQPVTDALIDKWNRSTQLSLGEIAQVSRPESGSREARNALRSASALKVINQSLLAQIEHTLMDEERLIKRTQLYRAAAGANFANQSDETRLLGRIDRLLADAERQRAAKRAKHDHHQQSADPSLQSMDDLLDPAMLTGKYKSEQYDPYIYDDGDYYQHLLGEIISSTGLSSLDASAAAADDESLSRSAAAARRKSRKAAAAAVDRRASKGRKIRYVVHAKLTNFMAPRPAPVTDEATALATTGGGNSLGGSGFAMDELFMNLFGGMGKAQTLNSKDANGKVAAASA